ncbi:hypothetical protein HXX76_011482 [Chlamydomonas incerta]|uniref:Guanylate cyclase domain-containing protein n=1 Tax=Chlamydomonas incerta TaxID=51695 RepID=A0A835SKD5_CHLIN|nr:hypothetical protein HXX76_011482 [Chlamydomonas incerta]|eukprot:KAG2428782.1 hypothetical protein HXX76_011482 [Chlamydomonas incerta]
MMVPGGYTGGGNDFNPYNGGSFGGGGGGGGLMGGGGGGIFDVGEGGGATDSSTSSSGGSDSTGGGADGGGTTAGGTEGGSPGAFQGDGTQPSTSAAPINTSGGFNPTGGSGGSSGSMYDTPQQEEPASSADGGGITDGTQATTSGNTGDLCPPVNPHFAAGKCLFTIDWAHVLPYLNMLAAPRLAGRLGVAAAPGSDPPLLAARLVRAGRRLRQAGSSSLTAPNTTASLQQLVSCSASGRCRGFSNATNGSSPVNRVPLTAVAGYYLLQGDRRSMTARQSDAAYEVLSYIANNMLAPYEGLIKACRTYAIPFPRTLMSMYWSSIGYAPPPNTSVLAADLAAAAPPPHGLTLSSGELAAVVVVPAVLLLLLMAAAVALVLHRHRRHLGLLSGKVLPPRHGPDVTIVTTDIQNSTLLWEMLPAEVMNTCLSIHHEEVRRALEAHDGFEASTEGDAFIIAFHTPAAALAFSVELQHRLLDADWPPLLLATADGSEVWAAPHPQEEELPVSGPLRNSTYATAAANAFAQGYPSYRQQQHQHTSNTVLLNKLLAGASMGRIAAANLMATFQQLWSAAQAPEDPSEFRPLQAQLLSSSTFTVLEDGMTGAPKLALRGLRVRIGMHSGVAPAEVVETAQGCCEYRGAALARAKAVCDMAGGGVTLLTEATHAAYRMGRHKLPQVQVLHVGSPLGSPAAAAAQQQPGGATDGCVRSRIGSRRVAPSEEPHPIGRATPTAAAAVAAKAGGGGGAAGGNVSPAGGAASAGPGFADSHDLLFVTDARLLPRHGLVPPFRPGYYLEPLSSLAAPLGDITAAFIYVSGVKALRQWDAGVLVEAMALLHATISRTVAAAGGYVVAQAAEGMSLVVFPGSGAEAVAWAVELQEAALELAWPEPLLEHDYGEEVRRDGSLILRGLRLRVGLEVGPATARLVPRTGRLDYTGRTLNRASRIASKASAGTVLVSSGLWQRALAAGEAVSAVKPSSARDNVADGTSMSRTYNGDREPQQQPVKGTADSNSNSHGHTDNTSVSDHSPEHSGKLPELSQSKPTSHPTRHVSEQQGPGSAGPARRKATSAAASPPGAAGTAAVITAPEAGGCGRAEITGCMAAAMAAVRSAQAAHAAGVLRELVGSSQGRALLKGVPDLVELVQVERPRLLPRAALEELEQLLRRHSSLVPVSGAPRAGGDSFLQDPGLNVSSLALLDQLELSYASTAAMCGDPDVQIHIVYALHNMLPMSLAASKWAAANNNRLLNESKAAAALARLNSSNTIGAIGSGIDAPGGSTGNKTTGKLIQPSLPYNIILNPVLQDRMPTKQTDVHWFSFEPTEPSDYQARIVAYDDFQSYYIGLWDWTRGNGTVIYDYEARPVGQLPAGIDPLPFEREPLTWMVTLYRKDWVAAARALAAAAAAAPGSGGSGGAQQQAQAQQQGTSGGRRSAQEVSSSNALANSGSNPIGSSSGSSGTSSPPPVAGGGTGAAADGTNGSNTAAAAAAGGGSSDAVTAAAPSLAEPRTWDELLALAAAVEGRDMDGDGHPDHGLCLDLARGCKLWSVLSAVYASMAQTEGRAQGVWFDVGSMAPLLDNPAMAAALALVRRLAAQSWPPADWDVLATGRAPGGSGSAGDSTTSRTASGSSPSYGGGNGDGSTSLGGRRRRRLAQQEGAGSSPPPTYGGGGGIPAAYGGSYGGYFTQSDSVTREEVVPPQGGVDGRNTINGFNGGSFGGGGGGSMGGGSGFGGDSNGDIGGSSGITMTGGWASVTVYAPSTPVLPPNIPTDAGNTINGYNGGGSGSGSGSGGGGGGEDDDPNAGVGPDGGAGYQGFGSLTDDGAGASQSSPPPPKREPIMGGSGGFNPTGGTGSTHSSSSSASSTSSDSSSSASSTSSTSSDSSSSSSSGDGSASGGSISGASGRSPAAADPGSTPPVAFFNTSGGFNPTGGSGGSSGSMYDTPQQEEPASSAEGGTQATTSGNTGDLCPRVNPHFAAGKCLFTIDWAHVLPYLNILAAPRLAGRLGVAAAPGSDRVWLQPPPSKPPAEYFTQLESKNPKLNRPGAVSANGTANSTTGGATGRRLQQAGSSSLTAPNTTASPQQLVSCSASGRCRGFSNATNGSSPVNSVPLTAVAGFYLLQGEPRTMTARQSDAVYEVLSYMAYQLLTPYEGLIKACRTYGAARSANASSSVNLTAAASLHPSDGPGVCATLLALEAGSAAWGAQDLGMPHSAAYRVALDEAAFRAARAPGAPAAALQPDTPALDMALAANLSAAFSFVLTSIPFPRTLMSMYWSSIGYAPPPNTSVLAADLAAAAPPPHGLTLSSGELAAVVVVPAVLLLLLMAAAVALVLHRHRRHLGLLSGKVLPPRHGPDVTIVTTDIQNSTLLWEMLPAEVMNTCLSIHHEEVRRALEAHDGFEASTEGDAFIIAFHTPAAALAFSVDLQHRLLDADWPPLLLATADGSEVWAAPHPQIAELLMVARASKAGNEAAGFNKPGDRMTAAAGVAAAGGAANGGAAGGVGIMLGDRSHQQNAPSGYPSLSGDQPGPTSFPGTPLGAMDGAGDASTTLPSRSFFNHSTDGGSRRSLDSPLPAGVGGREAASAPRCSQQQQGFSAAEASEEQQRPQALAVPTLPLAFAAAGFDGRHGPHSHSGSSRLWWGAVTRGMRQAKSGSQRAGAAAADAADAYNSSGPSSFDSSGSARPAASAAGQEVRGAPQLLGPAGPVAEATEQAGDAAAAIGPQTQMQTHNPRADSGLLSACGHVNQAVVAEALNEPPSPSQLLQTQQGAVEQAVGTEVRRGTPVSPQQVQSALDQAPPTLQSAPQCTRYVETEAEGGSSSIESRGPLPRWRAGQHLHQHHSASGAAMLLEDGASPFTATGAGSGPHGIAGENAARPAGCDGTRGAADDSMRLALAAAVFGAGNGAGNNERAAAGRVGGFRRLPFMSAHTAGLGGGGPDSERLSGTLRAGEDLPVSGPLRTSAYTGQGYAYSNHHAHQQQHQHTSNTLGLHTSRFITRLRGESSTSGEGGGRDSEPHGQLEVLLNKLLAGASMGRIAAANLMATFQQLWSAAQLLANSANSLLEDGMAGAPKLALRGLRVRIGMHSGVAPAEVVETAQGCCEYRGAALARAKAVCDMAGGGVTLLTEATHAAYRMGRHKLPQIQVLHVGSPLGSPAAAAPPGGAGDPSVRPRAASCRAVAEDTAATASCATAGAAGVPSAFGSPASPSGASPRSVLAIGAGAQSQELLFVTDARLLPRHGLVSPFRPGYYLEPLSSLAAPLGDITAAFIYVSGVKALRQWDAGVLVEAMALLHATISRTVAAAGGYVVAQAAEGMSLVVFPGSGAEAVAWAVELQEAALELAWPAPLLEHDYGEEVRRDGSLILRGLRLRVGLEVGPATARLVPRTGRLDYTGRTLNRASRIASKASAGTVLISSGLWKRALTTADASSPISPAVVRSGAAPGDVDPTSDRHENIGSHPSSQQQPSQQQPQQPVIGTRGSNNNSHGHTDNTSVSDHSPEHSGKLPKLSQSKPTSHPTGNVSEQQGPGSAGPVRRKATSAAASPPGAAGTATAITAPEAGGCGRAEITSCMAAAMAAVRSAQAAHAAGVLRELVGSSQGRALLKGVPDLVELVQVERPRLLPRAALEELEQLLRRHSSRLTVPLVPLA